MTMRATTAHQTKEAFPDSHGYGPGTSLPAPLRRDLETAFTHDFADVRVHTDGQAERQARRLGARAFTLGRDISFAPGAYAPATPAGRRLIAHELTHIVQQAASARTPEPALGAADTAAEHEAAVVAERLGLHQQAGPVHAYAPPVIQRQPDAGAPGPDDPPVPLQAIWSPTTPGIFSIHVDSRPSANFSRPRRAGCWACRRASPARTRAPRSATATPSPASWCPVPDKNDELERSDVPDHTTDERSRPWLLPR